MPTATIPKGLTIVPASQVLLVMELPAMVSKSAVFFPPFVTSMPTARTLKDLIFVSAKLVLLVMEKRAQHPQ